MNPIIIKMAKKYIWWETPEKAAARPARVIAQVMNMGDFKDVQSLTEALGESHLRSIIKNAEAGQFNERSWTYWHYRLGLTEPGNVPPMPGRKLQ
jgi:hypothetical protein